MFKEVTDMTIADKLWEAGVLYYISSCDEDPVPDDYWSLDTSTHPSCMPSNCPPDMYRYALLLEE